MTSPKRVVTESPGNMEKTGDKKIIFVLGGDRSGKSRYALSIAESYESRAFIATALPIDNEMKKRIETHQKERGGSFQTVEEPYDLGKAIRNLPPATDITVIDCLTVWLGNLLFKYGGISRDTAEIETFFRALTAPPCTLVIVSNEIGLGIIPGDASSRRFRDLMGHINQQVAAIADEAVFMVSGLPLRLKG